MSCMKHSGPIVVTKRKFVEKDVIVGVDIPKSSRICALHTCLSREDSDFTGVTVSRLASVPSWSLDNFDNRSYFIGLLVGGIIVLALSIPSW